MTKAELSASKAVAIALAAREHFLRDGFAGASMDTIAASARVSVKTVYSHFSNKNQLFSKVMVGACTENLFESGAASEEVLAQRFSWFTQFTQQGLCAAGKEYLDHLLSEDQLALYRAVTRDAVRFPELGQQYHRAIATGRTGILIAFLTRVFAAHGWERRNVAQDAASYEGLLRASVFEGALHGLLKVNRKSIGYHAGSAAGIMWEILTSSNESPQS